MTAHNLSPEQADPRRATQHCDQDSDRSPAGEVARPDRAPPAGRVIDLRQGGRRTRSQEHEWWMRACSTVCTRIALQVARQQGTLMDCKSKNGRWTNWEQVTQNAWPHYARRAGNMIAKSERGFSRPAQILSREAYTLAEWRRIAKFLAQSVDVSASAPYAWCPEGWRELVAEVQRA